MRKFKRPASDYFSGISREEWGFESPSGQYVGLAASVPARYQLVPSPKYKNDRAVTFVYFCAGISTSIGGSVLRCCTSIGASSNS